MTHSKTSEARKYCVRYQLFFLILIGIFALAILMNPLRFTIAEGQKLDLYLGPWQLISLALILSLPLVLAYVFGPRLVEWITDENKYIIGIVFTFLCWFFPSVIIQLLDSINSLGEISRAILPASMAGLLFGPLLGRKLYILKQENLLE
jgi:hypothetical protein